MDSSRQSDRRAPATSPPAAPGWLWPTFEITRPWWAASALGIPGRPTNTRSTTSEGREEEGQEAARSSSAPAGDWRTCHGIDGRAMLVWRVRLDSVSTAFRATGVQGSCPAQWPATWRLATPFAMDTRRPLTATRSAHSRSGSGREDLLKSRGHGPASKRLVFARMQRRETFQESLSTASEDRPRRSRLPRERHHRIRAQSLSTAPQAPRSTVDRELCFGFGDCVRLGRPVCFRAVHSETSRSWWTRTAPPRRRYPQRPRPTARGRDHLVDSETGEQLQP